MARRAHAHTVEIDSSHAVYISHPAAVAALVLRAARSDDRATWTAYSGIAAIVGPLVGGWLVDALSWRWIFAIKLPFVLVALALAAPRVQPSGVGLGVDHGSAVTDRAPAPEAARVARRC